MIGFAALHRQALDNPLLDDASRLGAWTWLILRAAWKPTPFRIGSHIVTLERGQLCASRSQLAEAWGWSPSAVERFLTQLETGQMIGRDAGQGRTVITIRNYALYQDISQDAGQATGQEAGQRSDSDRTTKEQGNKKTSVSNETQRRKRRANRPDGVSEETWRDFNGQRKKLFTDTALKGFVREAEKAGWSLEDAFAHATFRGWEGFNADWVEHRVKSAGAARAMTPAETAAFYRKIGREDEAEEIEQRERRRQGSGPARPIGEIVRKAANG